jgi:hypothetical protein
MLQLICLEEPIVLGEDYLISHNVAYLCDL